MFYVAVPGETRDVVEAEAGPTATVVREQKERWRWQGWGGGDARAQANVSFYPALVTLPPTLSFPISIKPMWIAFTSAPKRYSNLYNSS